MPDIWDEKEWQAWVSRMSIAKIDEQTMRDIIGMELLGLTDWDDVKYGRLGDEPTTALVLPGGGAKGSFQVGALNYFFKGPLRFEINLRAICGTSVGAINALPIFESGQYGIRKLTSIWLSLRDNYDMYQPTVEYATFRSYLAIAGVSLDLDPLSIDFDFAIEEPGLMKFLSTAWGKALFVYGNLLTSGVLGIWVLMEAADDFEEIKEEMQTKIDALGRAADAMKNMSALWHISPIENAIQRQIAWNTFENVAKQGTMKLRLATVCLEDGQLYYVTENGRLIRGHANNPEGIWDINPEEYFAPSANIEGDRISLKHRITKGTMASAAMPAIFRAPIFWPRDSDGNFLFEKGAAVFVDGGIREVTPIRAAAELGVERIISISTTPTHIKQSQGDGYRQAHAASIGMRSIDVLVNEVDKNDKEPDYGFNDGIERIFINPDIEIHGTQEINPGLILINMAYGYMKAHETMTIRRSIVEGTLAPEPISPEDYSNLINLWHSTLAITLLRKDAWEAEGGEPPIEYKPYNINYGTPRTPTRGGYNGPLIQHVVLEPEITAETLGAAADETPFGESVVYFFNESQLNAIRDLKHQILDWVEGRLGVYNYEQASMPFNFHQFPDIVRSIRDWWETWELHGEPLDSILARFDLWSQLPIYANSWGEITYESTVPQKPTPSNNLVNFLEGRD